MAFSEALTMHWENLVDIFVKNNSTQDYLLSLGVFLGLFVFFFFIEKFAIKIIERATKKTKTTWDDYVIGFLKKISWIFYIYLSFFIAMQLLTLTDLVNKMLEFFLVIFIGYYAGKGAGGIIDRLVEKRIEEKKKNENIENISMVKMLGIFGKIAVWILVLLMLLTNLGIEITPLIAGLGVGGIAIALALQAILGDLFSAFVLYFDKPFTEGDFIIVGNDMGVVKNIGIKTTRIKTLEGQELVISNSELSSTRINNYKKMEKRRVVFSFGVTYDTSAKKLEKIKKMVPKIIEKANAHFKKKKEKIELDRIHFKSFGDSSLVHEVVYYIPTSDYYEYMDIQEFINLSLFREFEKSKIEFAFPTQTVYVKK